MPRIKRVIDEVEKRWLGGPIFPPQIRLQRMFHESKEQLELMEFSLRNMAEKMEWQYDENVDRNKPTHFPEEGVISVNSEDSHFIYKVTAPLIHKRVKVTIPNEAFKKFEQIAIIYFRLLSNCSVLAELLGFSFERRQIVEMVTKKRC